MAEYPGRNALDSATRFERDLAFVRSELARIYEPEVIDAWLNGKGPREEKTPMELLREGDLEEVLALVNASETGAYS